MKTIAFFCLVLLASCSSNSISKNKSDVDIIQFAEHLSIIENEKEAIISIYSPETKKLEHKIIIKKDEQRFNRLSVLSSTHIGMLAKLESIDQIVGISNKKYLFNPDLIKRVQENKVIELGEETQIPVESILRSKSDVIIYSGFGKSFPHAKQLEQAGVTCLANYDWREIHPLGKAEWILFFGYLIGKPEEAKNYFNEVQLQYSQLKERTKEVKNKPKVISGNMWIDTWNAPAGESFNAELLKDAGADYIYMETKGNGSVFYNLEKIIQDNDETEFWLNPGMPTKKEILAAQPKLKYFIPLQNDNIYDFSKSANLYWEEGAISPHKVLSDYISVLHPQLLSQPTAYFYHHVR